MPEAGVYSEMAEEGSQVGLSRVYVRGDKSIPDIFNTHLKFGITGFPYTGGQPYLRGNSLIDPGDLVTAPNAAYVTQLGHLWAYYRVINSEFTLRATNKSAQPVTVIVFATLIPPASWGAGVPQTLQAWITSDLKFKTFNVESNTGSKNWNQVTMKIVTSELFNADADAQEFSGFLPSTINGGSNPLSTYQWFWGFQVFGTDGSAATSGAVLLNFDINYYTTIYQTLPNLELQALPGELNTKHSYEPKPEPLKDPRPIYPTFSAPKRLMSAS